MNFLKNIKALIAFIGWAIAIPSISMAQDSADIPAIAGVSSSKQEITNISYLEKQDEALIELNVAGDIVQDAITTDIPVDMDKGKKVRSLLLIEIKNASFAKAAYWLKSFEAAKNDPHIKGVMVKVKENSVQFRIRYKNNIPEQLLEQIIFEKNQGKLSIKFPKAIKETTTVNPTEEGKTKEPAVTEAQSTATKDIPKDNPSIENNPSINQNASSSSQNDAKNIKLDGNDGIAKAAIDTSSKTDKEINADIKKSDIIKEEVIPVKGEGNPVEKSNKSVNEKLAEMKKEKLPDTIDLEEKSFNSADQTNAMDDQLEQTASNKTEANTVITNHDEKPEDHILNLQQALVVMALLFFLAALTLWLKSRKNNALAENNLNIQILSTTMIAHNQRLLVVEVMGQQILVGSTESQISFVKLSSELVTEQLAPNKTPFYMNRTDEYSYTDLDMPRSERTEGRGEKRKIDTLNQRGNIDRSHLEQREAPRFERGDAVAQQPVVNLNPILPQAFPTMTDYGTAPTEERSFNLINKGLVDNPVPQEDQEDLNEDDLLKKIRSLNEPKS
jgi:flagellar biogenesis protein FliO